MPLINVTFTYNGAVKDQNLTLNLNADSEFDFFKVANPDEKSFIETLKDTGQVQLKVAINPKYTLTLPQISFEKRSESVKLSSEGVFFTEKYPNINTTDLYSSNLDDLPVIIETSIASLLFKWNYEYLESFFVIPAISSDDLKEIDPKHLSRIHAEYVSDDLLWFNKLTRIISELQFEKLLKVESVVQKLPALMFDLRNDLGEFDEQEPQFTFLERLTKKTEEIVDAYRQRKRLHLDTNNQILFVNEQYKLTNLEYQNHIETFRDIINKKKESFLREKAAIENIISNYENGSDLELFLNKVIENSIINTFYQLKYSMKILSKENHVVCDVQLPLAENVSKVKNYKTYVKDNRISEVLFSEREFKVIYQEVLYSIVFRLLNEIFRSDYNRFVLQVTINGWVNSINKRNGQLENKCILSISASRSKFEDIYLENIDLKAAFNDFKGISATSLIEYIPIQPIININKEDKRFIQSEDVLQSIESSTNLASVDWLEFEHLVRELFEKEFMQFGGEVKITQSSRDGGVDAIAFDPDPIRGGKIVIQSKRYTNVVGVSAIRDLYGTVLNEGATKGIIVTTSHYGNDAYEFAKGKPLTLLDGNNLLALLQKHGYHAHINITEAKKGK